MKKAAIPSEPTLRFVNKLGSQWLVVGRKRKPKIHIRVEYPVRRTMPKSLAEAKERIHALREAWVDSSGDLDVSFIAEHYILLWAIGEAEKA